MTGLGQILTEISCEYNDQAFTHSIAEKTIKIIYDHRYDSHDGTRWRSNKSFQPGTFSARIKCPKGNTSGLVSAFYLSSRDYNKDKKNTNIKDEIDFEFVGNNHYQVETNYYVNGKGDNEQIHELDFDTSSAFHEYSINWQQNKIEWSIDGKIIRVVNKSERHPLPQKSMYLYGDIWKGEENDAEWCGTYREGPNKPYTCIMTGIRVLDL